MCERFGKIVSTKAIVDNENGKCKGYGFVDFEDPENARVAKETLAEDGIQIQFAKVINSFLLKIVLFLYKFIHKSHFYD